MIEFVEYKPEHLNGLELQESQRRLMENLRTPGYGEMIDYPGSTFTAISDGKIVGCGGIRPMWENRAVCWSLVGAPSKKDWVAIVRRIRREMDAYVGNRLEADVLVGHEQGCRLAFMLGFEVECIRKKYAPDGSDFYLFSKVRE